MPLIYITGVAGSGKSTVENMLIKLGYEAYDEDDPNIGSAHNRRTGKVVKVPPVEQRSKEWFAEHEWKVFPDSLVDLKERAKKDTVFLCGNVMTENELQLFFDLVIALDVDDDVVRKRIFARGDNDFGKSDNEIKMILDRNKLAKQFYEKINCKVIDASKSVRLVVSDILELAGKVA